MRALQPLEVLTTLKSAGLSVSLTLDGGVSVSPASKLNDKLRASIREHKARLVQLLQCEAANDAAVLNEVERDLIEERAAIMEFDGVLPRPQAERLAKLHTDYLLHHWGCKTCCSAGQGRGHRCVTGAKLWSCCEGEYPK